MSTRYNDGSHYENHPRAAELQDLGAHTHRVAEQHEDRDHLTGQEHTRQTLEHTQTSQHTQASATGHGIASFGHDDIAALAYELGKREVALTDHHKRIGFMRQKSCDPEPIPDNSVLGDLGCPRCSVKMEPIEVQVEGLPLRELQLCPSCYLVTWRDGEGFHVRQGVPMKKNVDTCGDPAWWDGEAKEC